MRETQPRSIRYYALICPSDLQLSQYGDRSVHHIPQNQHNSSVPSFMLQELERSQYQKLKGTIEYGDEDGTRCVKYDDRRRLVVRGVKPAEAHSRKQKIKCNNEVRNTRSGNKYRSPKTHTRGSKGQQGGVIDARFVEYCSRMGNRSLIK